MWRAVALASGHFAHAEGAAVDHLGAEVVVEAIGAVDVEPAVRAADHVDEARVDGRVLLDARLASGSIPASVLISEADGEGASSEGEMV